MSLILNKLKNEAVIYCPLCSKQYKPENLQVVEQAGDAFLAHSSCPHCSGAVLSLLYNDFWGINFLGLVTDLSYQDALRLKNTEAVSFDDALGTYQLFRP